MNKIDYIHKDTRTLPDTITGEIQTITRWQDPTIEEYKKEIERLNKECDTYMKIATKRGNIIDELEKWLEESKKYCSLVYSEIKEDYSFEEFIKLEEIKNKLKELKGESN